MTDWKHDRLGAALRGENPTVLARMKSGFAVIGDYQYLPGYCVLIACPEAASLNELDLPARQQYLLDMTLVGDAIMNVCKPRRINYATLMNEDIYLHTHIHPRYDWEPEEYRRRPVHLYPPEVRFNRETAYSEEKHGELKQKLAAELERLMREHYPD